MKKKVLYFYFVLVFVISFIVFLLMNGIYIIIETNESNIIYINEIFINGVKEDFKERKISKNEIGVFYCEKNISKEEFDKIKGTPVLVLPRIRGKWHKITLNDQLVGLIGNEGNSRINIWNDVYKFPILKEIIKENNVLKIETYTDYKIGRGNIPVFITNSELGSKLYYLLKLLYSNFYLISIGMLFSLAVMEILLFSLSKSFNKNYRLFPICILIIVLYLFEYTVFDYSGISSLMFKKIVVSSLYLSSFIMSIAISKLYDSKIVYKLGVIVFSIFAVGTIISNSVLSYSSFYSKCNLLLLLLIVSWIISSLRHSRKNDNTQDYLIAVAGLILFITGGFDTITLLLFEGKFFRLSIYGIIFYAVAMLLVGMNNYVENQKEVYSKSLLLLTEQERLKKALITDELTGLYNHRYFYDLFTKMIDEKPRRIDIVLIDIDKFRPINELIGHDVGDIIIKNIADIIIDIVPEGDTVFRYGGEEFVVMCSSKECIPLDLSEKIRKRIIEDDSLQELTGYLPLTVSIGISKYPLDSFDPKFVISKAEKAMMYAKVNGRNRACVYKDYMDDIIYSEDSNNIRNQMLLDFVYTLASAIDKRDTYTGYHSEEVSRYAMLIAEEMNLDNNLKYSLRLGGLLHDLGKIFLDDKIIKKDGKLTKEEYEEIKKHPMDGYNIVKQMFDNKGVVSCVKSHHERYDGKGYPDGLKCNEIHILARIVCVADSYHAMVSDRSYRKGLGKAVAISELKKYRGTQFDPDVIDAFLRVL